MSFEVSGKIIAVLDKKIETQEQYPKRLCFEVFGEDRIASFNIQNGEEMTVSFDIDAREYQGRWYNSLRAWKVERANPVHNVQAQNGTDGNVPFDNPFGSNDDLPPF